MGLGAAGYTELGAASVTPQAARAPRLCTVQTCLKLLPMAFALVSELQLCRSRPFLCTPTMASAP